MVELASVFASQAKAAGVTINVKNDPNYYGDAYLKLAFSVDFWGTRGYLNQVQQGSLPNSPYNETHWPPKSGTGSDFGDLYKQALAETDSSKRIDIEHQMQQYEYDIGGYIIPYFNSLIDGYASQRAGPVAEQRHAEPGGLRARVPHHLVRLRTAAADEVPARRWDHRLHHPEGAARPSGDAAGLGHRVRVDPAAR